MKTLKLNSKGPEVERLQSFLRLEVDGIFGKETEEAVKSFQRNHNLKDDGIVGPNTWKALGGPEIQYQPIFKHITKSPGRKIKYLVIHYTAGSSSKGNSESKVRDIFLSREASADYIVDDDSILQVNPDPKNYFCWAVGDGKGKNGIYNKDCISIEICSNLKKGTVASKPNHEGWYFTKESLDNAIKLSRILMKEYEIDIDHVLRHYDCTGKLCPGIISWNPGRIYDSITGQPTDRFSDETEWNNFKQQLI